MTGQKLLIASCAIFAALFVSAEPPPIPSSITQTNAAGGGVAPTNFVDVLSVEFSPICSSCGCTNRYKLSIQREDLPEFWFTMPVQTSTNLVDWADKELAIGLSAELGAEFFRSSTNDLRAIDKPKRKPVNIVIPPPAEQE